MDDELPTRQDGPSARARARRDSELGSARYEPGEEIARGGMGRVVVAVDTLLGRTVALKEALCDDEDALRRFARETRITARLEHPSIVPVYDAGRTAGGTPYYVMRKVAGRPLDKVVGELATARERVALLPHLLAACDAVAHAHRRGVIHRDLKPTNILVGEGGETIVIDWGLARELDEANDQGLARPSGRASENPDNDVVEIPASIDSGDSLKTRVGQVIGTPGFMAPEQLRGVAVTPACDVYALGATLYHALANTPPHASHDADEMIALAAKGPPEPLAKLEPEVPRELVAIVERAMAYDDRVRYRDAGELAAELRRYMTGQLVAAHAYSTRERVVRFVRRHRASVTIGALALAALAIVSYLSVQRILQERNAATMAQHLATANQHRAEEAQSREAARADDLLVSQAAALADTNPIAAIGLLHKLPAKSESWRTARSVLAAVRRRGVPLAFAASDGTSGLVVDRAGAFAYSSGTDGIVRRHDLATAKSEQLYRSLGSVKLGLTGDERALAVAADAPALIWFQLANRAHDTVAIAAPVDQLETTTDGAVWADTGRAMWMLARGQATPVRLPGTFEHVHGLVMSPDRTHVVVLARPQTLVIELGATPRIAIQRDEAYGAGWSADGKRVAFAGTGFIDERDVATGKPLRHVPSLRAFSVAYVGDDLYFGGSDQLLHLVDRGGAMATMKAPQGTYTIAIPIHGAAVFVAPGSGLGIVVSRGGAHTVRIPSPYSFRSTGSITSSRFAISTENYIFVYDGKPMTPEVVDLHMGNTLFHGFAGPSRYLVGYMDKGWQLFDLPTHSLIEVDMPMMAILAALGPDGSYLLYRVGKTGMGLARPGHEPVTFDGEVDFAVAQSPAHATLVTTPPEAIGVELATGTRRSLWKPGTPIITGARAGGWLVLATRRELFRTNGVQSATQALPFDLRAIDIAVDGSVFAAGEAVVSRWAPDGAFGEHCRPASPPHLVRAMGRAGVVTIDEANLVWTCEPGATARRALPDGFAYNALARRAPAAVTITNDGQLAVYDMETRFQWALGEASDPAIADLAEDGVHVATHNLDHIIIYSLELPEDRAAYERLLDATTNLRIGESTNQIIWPTD